jgi:hypothetical protein
VIDPQRNIIDHRQRSKSLGQAAQFNRRQSESSNAYCAGVCVRLSLAYSISTKYDARESLWVSELGRIESVHGPDSLSHCERNRIRADRKKQQLFSSWPGLSRPSTSFVPKAKTWMPGTRPGMTAHWA